MPEPLSTEELEAMRAREQAATEGPWRAWDRGVGYHIAVGDELDSAGRPVRFLPAGMRADIGRLEDAEFIARSRQDVPTLLAEVERLTAQSATIDRLNKVADADCQREVDRLNGRVGELTSLLNDPDRLAEHLCDLRVILSEEDRDAENDRLADGGGA